MKRIVLLIAIATAIALCMASLCLPCAVAGADQGDNAQATAAEADEQAMWHRAEDETFYAYFERVWLDKIAGYACVLLGAVSAVAVTVSRVRKAHVALVSDGERLGESQRQLASTQQDLAATREVFVAETQAVKEALAQVLAAQQALESTYSEVFDTLQNLRKAVLVGFCNDGELVRTGYAKEVARLLGVQDEEEQ